MNSAAANSLSPSSAVEERMSEQPSFSSLIHDLEKEFWSWELKGTRDFGDIKHVSFIASSFCDLHVKHVKNIAKKYHFKLRSFNVDLTTSYNKLIITFTFIPKER
jgi:hypothetical protein